MTRVAGGTVTQTERNRVPPHHSSTETAKPSFLKKENFVFDVRRLGSYSMIVMGGSSRLRCADPHDICSDEHEAHAVGKGR